MLLDCLGQGILPIFEHLNHDLVLLIQLTQGIFLLLLKLLFYLLDVILEDLCLLEGDFDLLLQCLPLLHHGVYLVVLLLLMVTNLMPLVLCHHTLRANK